MGAAWVESCKIKTDIHTSVTLISQASASQSKVAINWTRHQLNDPKEPHYPLQAVLWKWRGLTSHTRTHLFDLSCSSSESLSSEKIKDQILLIFGFHKLKKSYTLVKQNYNFWDSYPALRNLIKWTTKFILQRTSKHHYQFTFNSYK